LLLTCLSVSLLLLVQSWERLEFTLQLLFKSPSCSALLYRYAFTILSNVGVYVAMLLLLEFVSEGSKDPDTAKLTSFNVWAYHNPDSSSLTSHDMLRDEDDSTGNDITSKDVWIFSVCSGLFHFSGWGNRT